MGWSITSKQMLIVCPKCETFYDVAGEKLGEGRSVRCARCGNKWFATAAELMPALAEAEGIASARGTAPAPDDEASALEEWKAALAAEPVAHGKFEIDEPEVRPQPIAEPPMMVAAEDAPPLAPGDDPAEPREDIETVAARRARIAGERRRRGKISIFNLPVAIAAMAVVIVGLYGLRAQVVRAFPQTASLYAAIGLTVNLRGLVFEDVKTSEEMHQGVPVLVVEGTVVNITQKPVDMPRLRYAVRNASGLEIYAWTAQPPAPTLSAGERAPFRSRLASPPADGRDLVVRFFNRRDLEGGR